MKSIKSIVLASIFLLNYHTVLWANSTPLLCPSVESIRATEFSLVQEQRALKSYLVWQEKKQYDTQDLWTFYIEVPFTQAVSPTDAKNKAIEALKSLHGSPHPEPVNGKTSLTFFPNIWFCEYKNDYQYFSAARTWVKSM